MTEDRPAARRLESLVLTLFSRRELPRFVRYFFGERLAFLVDGEQSYTSRAARLVTELLRQGRVTDELFDILLKMRPDRADVIEETRIAVLPAIDPDRSGHEAADLGRHRAEPGGASVASTGEDERAWRASLSALLDATPLPPEPARHWVEAAAVLPDFDPLRLRPLGETGKADDGLTQLASISVVLPDGRWVLQLRPRQEAIARLWQEGRLGEALEMGLAGDQIAPGSPYLEILRDIGAGRPVDIDVRAGYAWLTAAREIGDWFAACDRPPFDLDRLATLLERHETIEPLRRLTGTHFRGRKDELDILRAHHRAAPGSRRILSLRGIGGVGKSALLGKLLLEVEQSSGFPLPWVYLDFDHPEVEAGSPARLIELIARRLGLLYAGYDSSRLFYRIEAASAGDLSLSFDPGLPQDATPEQLVGALDRAVRRLPVAPSLLVVFDTFEQVQVQGPVVVDRFAETIDRLVEAMPYAQVIVSGRGETDAFPEAARIELSDLDEESAEAVLEALGIGPDTARRHVVRAVGTSPLSLHLVAGAIKAGQIDPDDLELLTADAQKLEVQGRLYTRFLGHITDGEVRRLAHPGLIVRRVTPGVIREVLADICGLDPDRAETLFERLPDHVWLFEPDAAAPGEPKPLRHRQDLREAMLELMVGDPAWADRREAIHDRAVAYYEGRRDVSARAEALYHRLMRNDALEVLDPLWSDDLVPALARSWPEPFPERARAWLGLRLGKTGYATPDRLRQADWEVLARGRAQSHLEADEPEKALAVLGERRGRSVGSPLVPLEIEALRRLGRIGDALDICRAARVEARDAGRMDAVLSCHLLGAELALEAGDGERAARQAGQARRLAGTLGDLQGELRALELLVRTDAAEPEGAGGPDQAGHLLELERAFARAGGDVLQDAPVLVGQVIRTLGSRSKSVLRKAALTFGNLPGETIIHKDAFQLADLLRHVAEREGGQDVLGKVAVSVGLPETGFDVDDLAGNSIRYNLQGDTLATVLEAFGDDEEVRADTVRMFM